MCYACTPYPGEEDNAHPGIKEPKFRTQKPLRNRTPLPKMRQCQPPLHSNPHIPRDPSLASLPQHIHNRLRGNRAHSTGISPKLHDGTERKQRGVEMLVYALVTHPPLPSSSRKTPPLIANVNQQVHPLRPLYPLHCNILPHPRSQRPDGSGHQTTVGLRRLAATALSTLRSN